MATGFPLENATTRKEVERFPINRPEKRSENLHVPMSAPVLRFAPSPNGYLHLGHALSALLNVELARAAGGRLLLRIEDIDATRCRPRIRDGDL